MNDIGSFHPLPKDGPPGQPPLRSAAEVRGMVAIIPPDECMEKEHGTRT
ncbi:hypothetical protein JW905_07890 [bacterium]|nr:hypothetical protein [candidate division CSSED10-310 bacterium]